MNGLMLEIDGLCVDGPAGTGILRGIDMVVGPGESVALLGPNGAGKSTLLGAVAGLVKPSAGSIVYGGHRLDRMSPAAVARAGVGLVPERHRVVPDLTVVENLRVGALAAPPPWWRARLTGRAARPADIDWVMDVFPGLRAVAHRRAGSLPAGDQQVVAVARVMVGRPKLLLVDEVSAGISPALALQLFDVLQTLRETGVALLLVEQFINLALDLADRVYVLDNGEITVSTEPAKVCLSDVAWQSTQPGGGTRASATRSKGAGA
jgi:branched-chain amino acid transport system ATP-binding protein